MCIFDEQNACRYLLTSHGNKSRMLWIRNVKTPQHWFWMKTNINGDYQICISALLKVIKEKNCHLCNQKSLISEISFRGNSGNTFQKLKFGISFFNCKNLELLIFSDNLDKNIRVGFEFLKINHQVINGSINWKSLPSSCYYIYLEKNLITNF